MKELIATYLLAKAMAESNPVDDLLELAEELREYEERYGNDLRRVL